MKYTSNIKNVIGDLRTRLEKASGMKPSEYSVDKTVRTVALAVYASNLRRIHNEGLDVNEGSIGKYSTKTTLIGSSSFVNKGAAAKAFALIKSQGKKASKIVKGASKWVTIKRNGENHHLAVLEGGYKKIRQIENREVSHINLQRTGRLMKDYGITQEGKDYIIGFTSSYGKKLREGQEKHFGKTIWGVSRSDNKIIDRIIQNFTQQATHA